MELKNFSIDIDGDGIALVTWNMPGRSMNVWNEAAIAEFSHIVERVVGEEAIKGLVITSGKDTFCAGADLTMLAAMKDRFALASDERGEKAAMKTLFEDVGKLSHMCRRM